MTTAQTEPIKCNTILIQKSVYFQYMRHGSSQWLQHTMVN